MYAKELKGAISAVASLQGHLLIAAGTKIILHKWTGTELNGVAFFDAPLHVVSLNIVCNAFWHWFLLFSLFGLYMSTAFEVSIINAVQRAVVDMVYPTDCSQLLCDLTSVQCASICFASYILGSQNFHREVEYYIVDLLV